MNKLRFCIFSFFMLLYLAGYAFPPGYSYYKICTTQENEITVGATNLVDFPVLVRITHNDLRTTANLGYVTNANGFDIVFTSSDGNTLIPFQLESYNALTGTLVAWVKVPLVSATVNTNFYMFFGNASVLTNQSSTATWDANYRGVWHLHGNENDGTSNAFNLTNSATTNQTPGVAADGQDMEVSQYLRYSATTGLNIAGDVTLETWINFETFRTGNFENVLFSDCVNGELAAQNTQYYLNYIGGGVNNNKLQAYWEYGNGTNLTIVSTVVAPPGTNVWHHVSMVRDATNKLVTFYFDGVQLGAAVAYGLNPTGGTNATLQLGREHITSANRIDADFDEPRISNIIRTPEWLQATYQTSMPLSTFVQYGATNCIFYNTSVAGPNQTICISSPIATMAANVPLIPGTGTWTLVSGTGTITTPTSATTTITGLALGTNIFRWTITNGPCPPSFTDVSIFVNPTPTVSNAGPDQTICATSSAFAGNSPLIGTGLWTLISGAGIPTSPTSPTSAVTGLGVGANIFQWTISNSPCAASSDQVTITRDSIPTVANAGADQTICSSTYTFTGNTATVGTGLWTLISGSGSITTPSSATSTVTGLGIGPNVFQWTITNGTCGSTSDQVTISVDPVPTISVAGPDQNLCATATMMAANTPLIGTAVWTLVSGSGIITSPASPSTTITSLGVGANIFQWTITNGVCPSSTDQITIIRDSIPTVANAGTDQTICSSSYTFTGNSPTIGTGLWTLISGSGSITTPSSAISIVTGLGIGANIFQWTISNGSCTASSDQVTITRDDNPTVAAAGPDQNICATSALMAANTPLVGTAVWTLVSGTGTITSPSSSNTTITGLGVGANTFQWTISNGTCPSSSDQVTILRDSIPTVADAGLDQTICSTSSSFTGNTPTIGTGVWTLISGSGSITTPSSATSTVTGLGTGPNVFQWTISNGVCLASSDQVTIISDANPTVANAGTDQTICSSSSTFTGNTPLVGTGVWTLVSGSGIPTTPSSPTSAVSGLGIGTTIFQWTISNGVCPSSSDQVTIVVDANPTVASAGPDQTICSSSATMSANSPLIGIGTWTLISGTGTITSSSSPNTNITGLGVGSNVFQWTIANGTCPSSSDQVTITSDANPTIANAGIDQTICSSASAFTGNTPLVGTGTWTLISGSGIPSSPSSPSSAVTGLGIGVTIFQWTISNGVCPSSSDQVSITVDPNPTIANAGTDQAVCATSATMSANTPGTGTAIWTLVSGSGTISSPSSPISPITGLGVGANVFQWTITNGVCPASSDQVTIISDLNPTIANAGTDQTVCSTSATMTGNTALIGSGLWTLVSGTGTITGPSSPNTTITGLGVGANVFQWTISNGVCPITSDQVTITRDANPTVAAAGLDQTICASNSVFTGNAPVVGTGIWTLVSGSGSPTIPGSPTSAVTGLSTGINIFQWTISNGTCPSSSDQVVITVDANPTIANAGVDQTVCATSANVAGNTPVVGTGLWTLISGIGTITSPLSPSTSITALGVGVNVFQWTISNGTCSPSSDQITITRDANPTTANAGVDQTICASSSVFAGNNPVVGTGIWTLVSGSGSPITPSSPTSAVNGLSVGINIFQWTISNGTCPSSSDQVVITVDANPTIANAGVDQTVCATSANVAGNTPVVGTGLWTLISGTGTITSPLSPSTSITALGVGANIFQWTISNGTCSPSSDQITITRDANPTTANAGVDQTICASSSVFAGNTPGVGTGTWTLVSGSGSPVTPSSPTSAVNGLSVGINIFQWTISNGTCPSSSDQVIITVDPNPTTANAGLDQTLCSGTATMTANTPIVGTGIWTLISGTGTITTASSPNTTITGLGIGPNVFQWTISNGTCSPSTDQITVTRDANPTTANAGVDQSICSSSGLLSGNPPVVGTGLWTLISGTGSPASPTSPNSAVNGLSVGSTIFQWTISNGTCPSSSDQVIITVDPNPTTANAGLDQTVCATTATMTANTPTTGTAAWTLVSGTGTITTASSPNTTITGLGVGANVFQWTISNGTCPPSTDQVTITRDANPTTSNAGPDQTICSSSTVFAGNTPVIGTGLWTLVSGTGIITTPTSPTSTVTGLSVGTNTFKWAISNGTCPVSNNQINIFVDPNPTVANAGIDQALCSSSTTMLANTPTTGTAVWTLVSGTGTITSPSSPNTTITGLGIGPNVFQWTISNGTCPPSTDLVIITRDANPTVANAGPDQVLCTTASVFAGNTPLVGTGNWTLISGTGTITSPSSSTSPVNGMSVGPNIFQWTISNGTCPSSSDQINITLDSIPTVANAGIDQTICSSSTVFTGNTPTIGAGVWTLISGTGIPTTPASPSSAVTGLGIGANIFQWTISNGICPSTNDQVTITVDQVPTIADAGLDQIVCSTSATMSANTPLVGTPIWTLVSGTGTITSPSSPSTTITALGVGVNIFQWTVSNGTCPSSSDQVIITRDANPTAANAGLDQTVCATSATMSANTPIVGTAIWTLISGTGTITAPLSPNTSITGLGVGPNIFQWTISNGTCPPSSDQVTITRDANPTVASAGSDQTICANTTTIVGNIPVVGTGLWTLVSGTGTITSPSSFNTTVTGLGIGANVFQWTISNGSCPPSSDQVIITQDANPTVANAGVDQTICSSSSSFTGNVPAVGTGSWTLISGSGIPLIPGSATSVVTGLGIGTNVFQWTISNGTCPSSSDQVTITVDPNPTIANAGSDQTVCSSTATMTANTPTTGTAVWTLVSGTGTITSSSSPNTTITGLGIGTNVFQWTISNGSCPPSSDQVTITHDANPTVANAGPDQTVCATSATMNGNAPIIGTGIWTLISGTGTITSSSSPNTSITGLGVGPNVFQWTISNGSCPPSTDQVTLTRDDFPSVALAGSDQTICSSSTTIIGNTPTVGTGIWTLISGTGTITSASSATTTVTGLGIGSTIFQWTISNGVCTASFDQVVITQNAIPSIANAGPDLTICSDSTSISGNIPIVGTGLWTLISGSGIPATPNSATTDISGLSIGPNVFQWTISNGVCPPSFDQVTINVDANPTIANAGLDQSICSSTVTMNANTAITGTGLWSLISGSGTITSPSSSNTTITGLGIGANVFEWLISNGTCSPTSDLVTITVDQNPTIANAGPDQTLCATSSLFAGNIPGVGTGIWTLVSGTGIISTPSSGISNVNTLGIGPNTFQWTISNGSCPASTDQIIITVDSIPTIANAGIDQTICSNTSSFTGNIPTIGTGLWTLISGTGIPTIPTSPSSAVTGLSVGVNIFQWTISNGICPSSSDQVSITVDPAPTTANAGTDQTICSSSSSLSGNTPGVGAGIWTLVSGSGTITSAGSPTSTVTGLGIGANIFQWTISNGTCPPSSDQVTINVDPNPTIANAGSDQTICSSSSAFTGNTPLIGTGLWTLISGSGIPATPNSEISLVNGLLVGANIFQWTISNGTCPSSSDQITITVDPAPTIANAGTDQTICSSTTSMSANIAAIGTGNWTLVSGSGVITSVNSETTTITGLGIGANVFQWTISNGTCPPSSDQVTITVDANPSVANAGSDQLLCSTSSSFAGNIPGVGTGLWTLISGSGIPTTPSSASSSLTGLAIGANIFQWTISNGTCPATSDQVIITVDSIPTVADAGLDQTICSASSIFTANTPSIGTGIWTLISGTGIPTTPGSPTSTVTGLSVGANIFQWTISNGICPASTDQVIITVDPNPTIANAGVDQIICSGSSIFAGNTPVVGTGIWTLISGSGIPATANSEISAVSGLGIGTNIFQWTISNGTCPSTSDQVTITVDQNPTIANAGIDQAICSSTTSMTANIASVGTGTWTLISGSGTIANINSETSTISGLGIGANTFQWTIANGTCPSTSDQVTIISDANPSIANAGVDQTICSATSSVFAGNIPVTGTGLWTLISGTGIPATPNSEISVVNGLTAGVNIFQWTISNGVCPSSSDTIQITIDSIPTTASAGPDQTICSSTTSVTLAGNSPTIGTGNWSMISGSGTISNPLMNNSSVSSLGIGMNTFVWTITNGICASSTDTVLIFVDSIPTIANAGPDQNSCGSTASITLNANTPTIGTGIWTLLSGSGTITSASSPNTTITGLVTGINSFIWTISNGVCAVTADTVNIIIDSIPTIANAGADQTICGTITSITLAGNTPTIGTGTWSVFVGTGILSNPLSNTSSVSNLNYGLSSFVWTITNGVCASSTDTVTIFVDSIPSVSVAGPDQNICGTQNTVLLSGNIPVTGTGIWTLISGSGTILNPTYDTTTVTGLGLGVNSFVWTIGNGVCSSNTDTILVVVDSIPTIANAGVDQTVCSNTSSAILAGNSATIGTGAWTQITGGGTIANPALNSSSVSGLSVGVNTFVWTISGGSCGSNSDTVNIFVDQMPSTANAGTSLSVCDDSVSLAAIPPSMGVGIWTLVSGSGTFGDSSMANTPVVGLAPGINVFQYTITNGVCPSSTSTVNIQSDLMPDIAFAGNDFTVGTADANLSGNTPVNGTGIWTLVSGAGSFSSSSDPNAMVSGLAVGQNEFSWTISNGVCPSTTDTVVVIYDAFVIPNAFSPDGDGINDYWVIPGIQLYSEAKLTVFNKWGNVVFESAAYQNDFAGRNAANQELSDDTYYYTLEISPAESYNGFIVIKRKN